MQREINEQDKNMEEKILSCAEALFLDKGYNSTSMTEIAREVGCTQALVHYYFRTKENLFSKIFANKMEFFVSNIVDQEDEKLPFTEMLRVRINRLFDLMCDNPRLPILLLSELGENPTQLLNMKEYVLRTCTEATRRFEELIQDEVAAGRIRETDVMNLTLNIFSLVVPFFLFVPFIDSIGVIAPEQRGAFIEGRKKEITETIIRGLQP